jgi:DNA repair protein RecN (Recombination protein N)
MLSALSIRDIVLIDKLDLVFERGLSALTGETGAGKSILLDGLSLALGGRGDAGLVRAGQAQGQVTAIFEVGAHHPARAILTEAGIDTSDEAILVRRIQSADGRTRAFVNDQPVSNQVLRSAGALLVEIHGQHDDRALADPATHRRLLDAFGGLEPLAAKVRTAHQRWRSLAAERDRQAARIAEARREADYLRHAHEELSKLAPEAGEEAQLAEARQRMMNAEKVAGDLSDAFEALDGSASPIPDIAGMARRLERKAQGSATLEGVVKALGIAIDALEEARSGLDRGLREAAFEPRELERVEERLFALRAASRKFSVPVEGLEALAQRFTRDIQSLETGEGTLTRLQAEADEAEAEYMSLARQLSAQRTAAGLRLDGAVVAELPPLKLERARFITRVEVDPSQPGADGIDQVGFHVQTNPGTNPGPIMKVASGGELSRFLLALKVVLADAGSAPTLVFDEIDSGVGGAVASAIGARLERLSGGVQVLCVTHAPQVAARAGAHFLIEKSDVDANRVATRVARLDLGQRREEVARMLSGETITEAARAQATALIGTEV